MSLRPATAPPVANKCRHCTQRLLMPTESAAQVRVRLLKVDDHRLYLRCLCRAWCPLPFRLQKILLETVHTSLQTLQHREACARCGALVFLSPTVDASVPPRLFKIHHHRLSMRCVCGSWGPVPLRLQKILLTILQTSLQDAGS